METLYCRTDDPSRSQSRLSHWYLKLSQKQRGEETGEVERAVCSDKLHVLVRGGGTGDPVMGDRPLLYGFEFTQEAVRD